MSLYDRIELIVAGTQSLSARPIDFEYDNDGNPINVIKYETTCPECGQMIVFEPSEIVIRNKVLYVGCSLCGKGHISNDEVVPVLARRPEIVVVPSGQRLELDRLSEVVDRGCPFIDPIEAGIFEIG
jgi:hypothetical protein